MGAPLVLSPSLDIQHTESLWKASVSGTQLVVGEQ